MTWGSEERETRLPLFALDPERLLQRSLEALPGILIWSTILGLTVFAFLTPTAIALFLIAYDLYWVINAIHVGIHLVASYRTLRRRAGIRWLERLAALDDPPRALPTVARRRAALAARLAHAPTARARHRLRRALEQDAELLADLQRAGRLPWSWRDVLHVVILPTYREPLALLVQSIDALAASQYPLDRLWVVVALEERAGTHAREIARALEARYAGTFGRLLTTLHPDGLPGERRVKSANATWAAKAVQRLLDAEEIPAERVIVSNFDADTVVSPDYFGSLTYAYQTTPDRLHCSYQPLPLYHNNIWQAPAITRLITRNSTFWMFIIQSMRLERLVTFSSHAMPFQTLVDVGFWDPAVVSEDSRIFWQCYVHFGGRYRTVPLFTTVSMDVTRAPTLWQTCVNQYKQKRRWAWGIENFPFIARAFLRDARIPLRLRLRHCLSMLWGWHAWATASLILSVLGWIPIFFGGVEFQQTVLAFNLPRMSRALLTLSAAGLIVNMVFSNLLLPPPPPGTPKRRYLWMALQWLLVPFIAFPLGSAPALDAVTRLMIGKYLGFWVTPKDRPASGIRAPQPVRIAARARLPAR